MVAICLYGSVHVYSQPVCRVKPNAIAWEYLGFVGIKEATGHNDGPVIEAIIRSTGSDKGSPYCASFVDSILRAAGVCCTPRSAWSPSFFPIPNRIYWQHNSLPGKEPERGDVIGLWFSNLKRIGHVGFWHQSRGKMIETVEANTGDANYGEATRNGNMIARKWRHIKQIFAISRFKKCRVSN